MGALDEVFKAVVPTVLGVLVDEEVSISEATSTYDPLTDSETDQSSTSFTTKASPPIPVDREEVDGTSIKRGDVRFMLDNSNDNVVSVGLTLTHNSVDWRIQTVTEHWSGDRIASYEVTCRR